MSKNINNQRVKIYLGDAVLYKDKTYYLDEKNGEIGIVNFESGAWGRDFPFIPLSKIDMNKVTDMMGRNIEIVNQKFKEGGILEGDKFINNENQETFYIDKINREDKNYPFYVIKSKPNDLPQVFSEREFERYLNAGLYQKMEKGGGVSDYDKWEGDVAEELSLMLDIPFSDAYGIIQANSFYMTQSWGKDLTAEETAKLIDEKTNIMEKGSVLSDENAEKIAKLQKVVDSAMIPDAVKEKARLEIEKLRSEEGKDKSEKVEQKGLSAEQREINKKALALITKNKFDSQKVLQGIVHLSLEDANYHTAAFEFAKLVDSNIKTKQDWYRTETFKITEKQRDVAIEISQMCGWEGEKIVATYEFVLKMLGFHNLFEKLNQAMKDDSNEGNYPNAIDNLTSNQMLYASTIAPKVGLTKEIIGDFIKRNGLTEKETLNLMQGVGMGKVSGADFMTAVIGLPNNEFEEKIVAFAKSDEAFKAEPKKEEAPIVKDDRVKGKNISDISTYIPHRAIESIVVTHAGKKVTLKGSDIFDGIYVENKVLGIKDKTPKNDSNDSKYSMSFFDEEGLGFKYIKNGKFDEKSFKDEMLKRTSKKTSQSTIKLWGKELGMDVSKYIDGDVIENIEFANDSTSRAKKLFKIFTEKNPKVARTQFEEETFEFRDGGKLEDVVFVREKVYSFLNPMGYSARVEDWGNGIIHIEPSTTKVGNNRKDFFDGMQITRFDNGIYEVSEYQAGENKNELYVYKETKSLITALKDLIKGNKRKPIKKYAKGGYTRPGMDIKTTGDYEFRTNSGLGYEFRVVGFERQGDDTDSLYFDDLEKTAKRELGAITIKNNAWKKLSKGQTITAVSSTGVKGKLTRMRKFELGGTIQEEIDYIDNRIYNLKQLKEVSNEDEQDYFENHIKNLEKEKAELMNKRDKPKEETKKRGWFFKNGGQTPAQKKKIEKVMHEFKMGTLKSSSCDKVTDRDQAIAIALSEAGLSRVKSGKLKDKSVELKDKGGDIISNEMYAKLDKISDWKIIKKQKHPLGNNVYLTLSQSGNYYRIAIFSEGKILNRTATYFTNNEAAEKDFNQTIKDYFAKGGKMKGWSHKK